MRSDPLQTLNLAEQLVAAETVASSATAEASRASVLVVEDDLRSARMVSAHLQSAGYRVSIADSTAAAQAAIELKLPDLVLCDVCLPDMDGIRLTTWVRQRFASANLPIALITSSDDRKILARGLEAGADDFLAKPVNSLELRTRVQSLLRNKILADELVTREKAAASFSHDANRSPSPKPAADAARPATALVVEDNPQERRLIQANLIDLNCEVLMADGATSGLEQLEKHPVDLIVLDLLLPDRSGYDFIKTLKANAQFSLVPILVVSAMSEVKDRVKAIELGADDYIVKGFERLEFEARVRRLLRHKKSFDQLQDRCNDALKLASTDALTGLYTHGFMRDTLRSQLSFSQRYGQPYSVIFGDLDHFKQINDRHGHAAGDAVLRSVAATLSSAVRQSDTLVRYGGEEFVACLPRTGHADAVQLAERMRQRVEAQAIDLPAGQKLRVTMSIGVASYPDDASDADTLVQRCDAAMYHAKQTGRNRVCAAGQHSTAEIGNACVLVADDDERNRRLIDALLAPEGYQVLFAENGLEAVEMCARHRPDVILMDAMMPKMSGFEACERLKQDMKTQLLPIIMVTALNSREDKVRGIDAGADDFVSKPIDKMELLIRIRALIRQKRNTDLLDDAETVIYALARAVEARDPLLGNHVERVAEYAVALGKALGLSERELSVLRRASLVHDIGKIAIPDPILLKPGELNAEERAIIEQHPDIGCRLLEPLKTFRDALPAVRFHHERLNGSGYPLGLRDNEIPLAAQVLALADVYDALTAPRPYRAARSPAEAIEVLRDEARRGLHDPELVRAFIAEVSGETDVKVDEAQCAVAAVG